MTISKINRVPLLSIDILDECTPEGQRLYENLLDNDDVFTLMEDECLEGSLIALSDADVPVALLSKSLWQAGRMTLARCLRQRACQVRCNLDEFDRWNLLAVCVEEMPAEDWYCQGCVN